MSLLTLPISCVCYLHISFCTLVPSSSFLVSSSSFFSQSVPYCSACVSALSYLCCSSFSSLCLCFFQWPGPRSISPHILSVLESESQSPARSSSPPPTSDVITPQAVFGFTSAAAQLSFSFFCYSLLSDIKFFNTVDRCVVGENEPWAQVSVTVTFIGYFFCCDWELLR